MIVVGFLFFSTRQWGNFTTWKWWDDAWLCEKKTPEVGAKFEKKNIDVFLGPPRGTKWMGKGALKQPLRVQTPPITLQGAWFEDLSLVQPFVL